MKTIGVIGAMKPEVAEITARMDIISEKSIVGSEFLMGKLHGKNVVAAASGAGKVNAAICTQVLVDMYGVDYVLSTGTAGALSRELKAGDIVLAEDLAQHDFDAAAAGAQPGVNPSLANLSLAGGFFASDETLLGIAREACAEAFPGCEAHMGRVATGDMVVAGEDAKKRIRTVFGACCVDMEGAAVAQACVLNKIPFLVIRSISDQADGNARASFAAFSEMAAKNAAAVTELVVKNM